MKADVRFRRPSLLCYSSIASEAPHVTDIFVMTDGDLTIDHGPVSALENSKAQIEPLLRRTRCEHLTIRAAQGLPFGAIGRITYLLQSSGCPKIGILTEPADEN